MKIIILLGIVTLIILVLKKSISGNDKKLLDQPAPKFNLKNSQGSLISLESFKGKWLVIYFYPKDDTPGCTKESCNFRDNFQSIQSLNASIVGVSLDPSSSHQNFQKKYSLPFMLLSDGTGETAQKYGALNNFVILKFAKRQTFVVDPKGIIRRVYRNVNPLKHADEVMNDLRKLTSNT